MWVASAQMFQWPSRLFVVRTQTGTSVTAQQLVAALQAIEPGVAFGPLRPLDALVSQSQYSSRLIGVVGGGLGFVALVLAAVGISGVVAHAVASRRREFGLRVALGASPRAIGSSIIASALWPVAAGGALGRSL